MNPFRLWNFHGGLRLDGHKRESAETPLQTAPVPKHLVFPLQQRGGERARPAVAPGDRVLKGQVIAEGEANPPIHASSSGLVRSIEERPMPHPSGLADLCIVIDTDGEDAAVDFGATDDYRNLAPDELRRRIHRAGVVGLGGAAFPTAAKLAPGADRPVDTLILNGAECEPYITCDDSLLRYRPRAVLDGANILMHVLGAERCLLAIEADMPEAAAALEAAMLGGDYGAIRIVRVPARYPTGGERQLIQVLTGREIPSGGFPADIGVVCQNVGTAAAVHDAVVDGAPLVSRIVTVTGRGVRRPRNLVARIGTPIADLVAECGGYTGEAERLILGGPMTGFALSGDDLPVVKSAHCILVAGRGEFAGDRRERPCIRCGACAEVCPASLLPQQLYWHARADQMDRVADYHLADCIECGCCDVVCPSHIPLVRHFQEAKAKIAARQRDREKAEHARLRFEARQARQAQEQRERAESARRRKESLGSGKAPEIQQALERARAKRAEKAKAEARDDSPASDG
jgi:electron transport complex protein RnfC